MMIKNNEGAGANCGRFCVEQDGLRIPRMGLYYTCCEKENCDNIVFLLFNVS